MEGKLIQTERDWNRSDDAEAMLTLVRETGQINVWRCTAKIAQTVLHFWEREFPWDMRPRQSIQAMLAYTDHPSPLRERIALRARADALRANRERRGSLAAMRACSAAGVGGIYRPAAARAFAVSAEIQRRRPYVWTTSWQVVLAREREIMAREFPRAHRDFARIIRREVPWSVIESSLRI